MKQGRGTVWNTLKWGGIENRWGETIFKKESQAGSKGCCINNGWGDPVTNYAWWESCQISKMKLFAKAVKYFCKNKTIVDVWHGFEYSSESGTEWLLVVTKLLCEILLTVVLTVWYENADVVIIHYLSFLELLICTYLSKVDIEIVFFLHFISSTFYNISENIWHRFTNSSKIGLLWKVP